MTRTVLLVSELGVGMGHAMRLLAIARVLKASGFRPVAAMRELWVCTDQFRDLGVPVVQAPAHRGRWPAGETTVESYAGMSAACGFHAAEALWPSMLGWNALFDLIEPSVVVADYSPLSTLAAFDRCPVLAVGDGFVLPPPHLPRMPILRTGGTKMDGEDVQIRNAAVVLNRLGRRAPKTLPALIGGTAHVVCTYPQLDIYAALRQQPADGSLLPVQNLLPIPPQPKIFLYLSAQSRLTLSAAQAVATTGLPIEAYIRDASPEDQEQVRRMGVTLHLHPPPLTNVLGTATLVIHHGGIGTLETCLAAGRAQLLVPSQFEQTLNAKNAVARGLAVSIERTDTWPAFAEKARDLATNHQRLGGIRTVAAEIGARDHAQAARSVAALCAAL